MSEADSLVLEIWHQDTQLKMSISEQKELTSTIRQYSQCPASFSEINKVCEEITGILNRANKQGILDSDLIDSLKKSGQFLWENLLSHSVKNRLTASAFQSLVLSLDEELVTIPWELLYDGNDFLCLKFDVGRLIRTKEKANQPKYRDLSFPLRMLILANPTNDLHSAYLEGLQIKNKFERRRDKLHIDFKSTYIDTIYVKKNLRDYDMVHFAGHCEYDRENYKNTGWVFNNGKFTAEDVLKIGETMPLPSLVFSNACQSAKVCRDAIDLEYQEEAFSLASAFLFTGTRHYIGAIRKIEDAVSLTFAGEFYAQLMKGKSVGESMRCGRLRLTEKYGIHSIFWASYLLYGDPTCVLFEDAPKLTGIKPRKFSIPFKKYKGLFISFVSTVVVCGCLYMALPSVNPNALILYYRSRQSLRAGKNQETIALCKQSIAKDPMLLSVYPLITEACLRQGKRDEALQYYFEYALLSQKKHDLKNLASAYTDIAWVYQQQGNFIKAVDFYQKAIGLSVENNDRLNKARAMRKLAVWHIDKNEFDKALELLTKSSEINRERQYMSEYKYNLACDYFDMGLLFFNKDDYATAKEFYKKSQRLFVQMKLRSELSDCYFNLGEIYLFEKQYHKALESYQKGLRIDIMHDNKPSIASDYNMIGELYVDMDNLEKAETYFKQAMLACKEINAQSELAATHHNLGLLYKKRRQRNKAREYLRLAQEFYSIADTPDYQKIKKEILELDNAGPAQ